MHKTTRLTSTCSKKNIDEFTIRTEHSIVMLHNIITPSTCTMQSIHAHNSDTHCKHCPQIELRL